MERKIEYKQEAKRRKGKRENVEMREKDKGVGKKTTRSRSCKPNSSRTLAPGAAVALLTLDLGQAHAWIPPTAKCESRVPEGTHPEVSQYTGEVWR